MTVSKKRKLSILTAAIGIAILLSTTIYTEINGYSLGYKSGIVEICAEIEEYPAVSELTADYETIVERMAVSSRNYEEYMSFENYINGTNDSFQIYSDDWAHFYLTSYCLVSCNTNSYYIQYDSKYMFTETTETLEERQNTINTVIDIIGLNKYSNAYLEIINVSEKIRSVIKYDSEYMNTSVIDSLEDGKGVCIHYAKIMTIILNAEGIPCRTVYGYLGEEEHAWNEVYIDGSWYTVDACNSITGFVWNTINYNRTY